MITLDHSSKTGYYQLVTRIILLKLTYELIDQFSIQIEYGVNLLNRLSYAQLDDQ